MGRSYYAGVSSDRTNLSPFTKDYRGLALSCDFIVFEAREGTTTKKEKKKIHGEKKTFLFSENKNFGTRRCPLARTVARRAPLAERSAVNRQVLGSIPSAGVIPRRTPLTGGSSGVEQWTVKCLAQLSIGREFKSPSPDIFYFFLF